LAVGVEHRLAVALQRRIADGQIVRRRNHNERRRTDDDAFVRQTNEARRTDQHARHGRVGVDDVHELTWWHFDHAIAAINEIEISMKRNCARAHDLTSSLFSASSFFSNQNSPSEKARFFFHCDFLLLFSFLFSFSSSSNN
jgi:hypothetical protein